MLGWMGISIDKVIAIVDEAHNLPDWARDSASESMTLESINRAIREVKEYGYQLPEGRDHVHFLNLVEASIEKLSEEHILDGEDEGHLHSHIVSLDLRVKYPSNAGMRSFRFRYPRTPPPACLRGF